MMQMASDWTKENGYVPYYLYRQKNILGNLENVGYCKPGEEVDLQYRDYGRSTNDFRYWLRCFIEICPSGNGENYTIPQPERPSSVYYDI